MIKERETMDLITVVPKGTGDGVVSIQFGTLDPFDDIDADAILQCLLQLWISARLFQNTSPENNEVGVPEYDVCIGMAFDNDTHICRFKFRGGNDVFHYQCSVSEDDLNRAFDQLFLQPRRNKYPVKEVSLDFRIYNRQRPVKPET